MNITQQKFNAGIVMFVGLIFSTCSGVVECPAGNTAFFNDSEITGILNNPNNELSPTMIGKFLAIIQEADKRKILTDKEFWHAMKLYTGDGSFFSSRLWAEATPQETFCILKNLVTFGEKNKEEFFENMRFCEDNGAPILTRLIVKIETQDSELFWHFIQILKLVSTLKPADKIFLLTQKTKAVGCPIDVAKQHGKQFIVDALTAML